MSVLPSASVSLGPTLTQRWGLGDGGWEGRLGILRCHPKPGGWKSRGGTTDYRKEDHVVQVKRKGISLTWVQEAQDSSSY